MQNVLVIASTAKGDGPGGLLRALHGAGYAVARTSLDYGPDGTAADRLCDAFRGRPPDLLITDLSGAADSLPLRHALRLLRQTWGEDAATPLRLTLLDPRHLRQPDWVAYTDDFLLPPFSADEVLARITLLLFHRRHVRFGDTVPFADILLDLAAQQATDVEGRLLPLTPREYQLLQFLTTHRGKFFARHRLLDMVWGIHFEGGERTVDIHVRRLRAKLPPGTAALLETRRGIGYGFCTVGGDGASSSGGSGKGGGPADF